MKNFGIVWPGKLVAAVALAAVVTFTTGCASQGAAPAGKPSGSQGTATVADPSAAREQRIQLAENAVRNGKYELPDIGAFQLEDGTYQEKYGEGASQVKRIGIVTVAFGDLDADGVEDAAVVLWANTGGSGTFVYLAPVLNKDGKGQQAGAQLLGDRVQVKAIAIESGKIALSLLTQGTGDAMASPSLQTAQEYRVQGDKLVNLSAPAPAATAAPKATEKPAAEAGQAATSGVQSRIWIWQRYVDSAEKDSFLLPYPAAYRLELLTDGKFRFRADCNTGSGSYTLEGSRLSLKPGPMTRMACQPGSRSDKFLELLGNVATFTLKDDTLHLNLKADAGDIVMTPLYSVTGRITGPAGETVPAGATVEAMVVSREGTQIGGSIVKAELPMSFEAPFKPANITPSAPYTLEVTIRDAQKNVIFKNSRTYQVLTQGNPTYNLEIEVTRVR